jgi:hypothetical protein
MAIATAAETATIRPGQSRVVEERANQKDPRRTGIPIHEDDRGTDRQIMPPIAAGVSMQVTQTSVNHLRRDQSADQR